MYLFISICVPNTISQMYLGIHTQVLIMMMMMTLSFNLLFPLENNKINGCFEQTDENFCAT